MAGAGLHYPWRRLVYRLESEPPYRDPNGWVSGGPASPVGVAPIEAYQDLPVIVLLGERGVGKSDIISGEASRLDAARADWRFLDLPDLGPDAAARLRAALKPTDGGGPRFVLLDSLDEALDTYPGAWQLLAEGLQDLGKEGRLGLRLRITCRSSRWPIRLRAAFDDMWPDQVSYLGVAGLTRADVVLATESNGLDSAWFVGQLEQRRLVVPLASWPVTLNPLLDAAARNVPLPANAVDAFAQACERLCTETNPSRRDGMTADHPSPADLLAAGRRAAAALQFGAQSALVDLREDGAGLPLAALARGSEPDGAGRDVACTEHLLRRLTESALLSPLGPRRWGFAHRSFQEFLAAQYLGVHRAAAQVRRAVLLAGEGSSRHVVASQREVAAWLAVFDDSLFEEILACDPQVLLLADPLARPAADRHRLTGALLDLVREDFTVQLDPLLLYRLDHRGLAGQLSPRLRADQSPSEIYAALMIARACPQPDLTAQLMALADNHGISENLRSLAVEAVSLDTAETRTRLLEIAASAPADLAGAVLARLWPRYVSTADMLSRLPEPRPNVLGAGWSFLHALPRLLGTRDLPDALDWVRKATSGSRRDHVILAVNLLAWIIRTCEPLEGGPAAAADERVIAQVAEAVVGLARSGNLQEPGMPLEELGAEFAARLRFRRAVGRRVLEQASVYEVDDLAFGTPVCLFPPEDAAYWARQLPSLPGAADDKLSFVLRDAPADPEEWAQAWELAQAVGRVRVMTAHWYALPVHHPLAADAQRRREAAQRAEEQRAERRYDEAALSERLAALAAGDIPARRGWFEVIIDLHRTTEGDEAAFDLSLDLSSAPSFPAPGSELNDRLLQAAFSVLGRAPVIAADANLARLSLRDVPELLALSLLFESGRSYPGELDASRWAGLALALIFVPTAPGDPGLRSRLLGAALGHSGDDIGEAIAGLMDPLAGYQLASVMDRLLPVRTPRIAAALTRWARSPGRDPEQRDAVLDALARYGDADVLGELRRAIPLAGRQEDVDPGTLAGQEWLSSAHIAVHRDAVVSLPAVIAAVSAMPALARPFLDRLADETGLGDWPMDLSDVPIPVLGGLYDLIAIYGPAGNVPLHDESGAGLFGPDQRLERMGSQLANIIASRGTHEAADQIAAMSGQYPDRWQLRELARHALRDAAEQTWQPVGIEDLLKLADDRALRLVRDEHQLGDVVMESVERLQQLISAPNGWRTLLWHKSRADAASGWWPAWEEDLSDLVATFLQHDLAARHVIVNREVQILRPGLDGQRTDIHVQASTSGAEPDPAPLTVIIECKGCWNSGFATDLAGQLVAKYLSTPGRNAGIYLVGYFDNARWDHQKNPGREHTAHSLQDVKDDQARIAQEEATQKSVSVRAYILDCRLPSASQQSS